MVYFIRISLQIKDFVTERGDIEYQASKDKKRSDWGLFQKTKSSRIIFNPSNDARAKVRTCGIFNYLFDYHHLCQLHNTLTFFLLSDSGAPPPLTSTFQAHFIFMYCHSKIRTDSNGTFLIFWRNTDQDLSTFDLSYDYKRCLYEPGSLAIIR